MNAHAPVALLVAGILFVCAALAIVMRMRKLERAVEKTLHRLEAPKRDADRDHARRDDVVQLRQEVRSGFDALRSVLDELPEKLVRRLPSNAARAQAAALPPAPTLFAATTPSQPQPRDTEDAMTHLVGVANRIMQICPATLDELRSNMGWLSAPVLPWHNDGESTPAAFVVEHRGSCYAIPNVIKSARFPQAWFNCTDFGMNDEIQRVVSLPRLRRSGHNKYEVQEPGVFTK